MRNILIITICVLLSACVTVAPEKGTEKMDFNITCKQPYQLTQDCDPKQGPTRKVDINGVQSKVASNEDGTVVWVMPPNFKKTVLKDAYLLNSPSTSKAINKSYRSIISVLNEHNVEIQEAKFKETMATVISYVMILGDDGYSVIKRYTVE